MWLVPVLLLVPLALLLTGCSRVVYPGDGRLVIVEIDPELENCSRVGEAVRAGIRYWDAAGARLRTADQLQPEEQSEAASAPRLSVRGDNCSELGADVERSGGGVIAPAVAAQYNFNGDIQLFLRRWDMESPSSWLAICTTIAHETGHAIGLDHIDARDAVMHSGGGSSRPDLSAADLVEHARVWP